MSDLVSALLNVSRIDLGTFVINPVPLDIVELIRKIITGLDFDYKRKEIVLEESYQNELPAINLDLRLSTMVFENLLTNAIKYTDEHGKIIIKVYIEKNDTIRVDVSNSGCGIPLADQPKIFTKLYRAGNVRDKVTDGTGLGLYLAKSIVLEAGGNIWFESVENEMTTFSVSFPLPGMRKTAT
jgi:two-component system sensor histidine kinase VicK